MNWSLDQLAGKNFGEALRKVGGLVLLAPYARACCAVRVAPVNGCERSPKLG